MGAPSALADGSPRHAASCAGLLPQLVSLPIYSGIRKAEVIRQAPGRKLPVILHAPRHPAAEDYRRLAREVDWGLESARAWERQQVQRSGSVAPVSSSKAQPGSPVVMVPLSAISASGPVQTRRPFSPDADEDDRNLVESVRAYGVLQPVLLGPDGDETARRYRIIAGHRRVAACQHAGLERVPAIVRSFEEIQAAEIGIIENLQRADLLAHDMA